MLSGTKDTKIGYTQTLDGTRRGHSTCLPREIARDPAADVTYSIRTPGAERSFPASEILPVRSPSRSKSSMHMLLRDASGTFGAKTLSMGKGLDSGPQGHLGARTVEVPGLCKVS